MLPILRMFKSLKEGLGEKFEKAIMIGISIFLFAAFPYYSHAAGVTLAWDAPSGGGAVTGYNLYYGTSSGSYPNKVGAINSTQYVVSGLDEDKVYYFIVKAYNDAGESGPSNMVAWRYRDTTPPLPPGGVGAE